MPGSRICRYFGTSIGCPYGTSCRFEHPGPEPELAVTHNLSEPLTVIDVSHRALEQSECVDANFARQETIASFSWMTGQNEIAVPGSYSQ